MSAAETYDKPIPTPTPESAPYWDGLSEHRLLLQQCGHCGRVRHYPQPMCPACHSMDVGWIEASGRARVHSWTVTHHAFHPGFRGDLPYLLATVDLDEGVRLQAHLRGVAAEDVHIGMPVRVAFERAGADLTLPYLITDEP